MNIVTTTLTRGKPARILIALPFIAAAVFFSATCLRSAKTSPPSTAPPPNQSFGVGFDLNPSYVSAAIHLPNGTTVNIAKRDATPAYLEVMHRLSLDESRHFSPPYQNLNEVFADSPRQLLRRCRKALGLVASSDMAPLAEMIRSLIPEVERLAGAPVQRAAATVPHLPALYDQDTADLFDYLHIGWLHTPSLRSGNQELLVYHPAAALAANNFGLCAHPENELQCQDELHHSPNSTGVAYTVGYYPAAAVIGVAPFYSADFLWGDAAAFNYDLGSNHRNIGESYWDAVYMFLKSTENKNLNQYQPLRVMLYGDANSRADPRMKDTLRQVLTDYVGYGPKILDHDQDFLCARGAAVLARQFASRFDAGPGNGRNTTTLHADDGL